MQACESSEGINFTTNAKRLAYGLKVNNRRAAKNDAVSGVAVDEMKDEGDVVTDVVPADELENASKSSD